MRTMDIEILGSLHAPSAVIKAPIYSAAPPVSLLFRFIYQLFFFFSYLALLDFMHLVPSEHDCFYSENLFHH